MGEWREGGAREEMTLEGAREETTVGGAREETTVGEARKEMTVEGAREETLVGGAREEMMVGGAGSHFKPELQEASPQSGSKSTVIVEPWWRGQVEPGDGAGEGRGRT